MNTKNLADAKFNLRSERNNKKNCLEDFSADDINENKHMMISKPNQVKIEKSNMLNSSSSSHHQSVSNKETLKQAIKIEPSKELGQTGSKKKLKAPNELLEEVYI